MCIVTEIWYNKRVHIDVVTYVCSGDDIPFHLQYQVTVLDPYTLRSRNNVLQRIDQTAALILGPGSGRINKMGKVNFRRTPYVSEDLRNAEGKHAQLVAALAEMDIE